MPVLPVPYDEYLWPSKDPDDETDYGIDVSDVVPADDSILSADWTVPAEIAKGSVTNAGLQSSTMLAGGTNGETHIIEIVIHTAQGRDINRTMRLPIAQKRG